MAAMLGLGMISGLVLKINFHSEAATSQPLQKLSDTPPRPSLSIELMKRG